MWGSDWPVLNLNGDYLLWHSVANDAARFELSKRGTRSGVRRQRGRVLSTVNLSIVANSDPGIRFEIRYDANSHFNWSRR
jgi:hypothetical protein